MDRKSIAAFVLIFIIILVMPYYFKLVNPPGTKKGPAETVVSAPPVETPMSTTTPPPGQTTAVSAPFSDSGEEKLYTIRTPLYRATLSSRGGGTLKSFILNNFETRLNGDTALVELINPSAEKALLLRYISINGDTVLLNQNFKMDFSSLPVPDNYRFSLGVDDSLRFVFGLYYQNALIAQKAFTFFGNRYLFELRSDLRGNKENMASDFYELSWGGGLPYTEPILADEIRYSKAFAYSGGEPDDLNIKQGRSEQKRFVGATSWTAIRTKYFTSIFIPKAPAAGYRLTGYGQPLSGNAYQKRFGMFLRLPLDQVSTTEVFVGPLDYQLVKGLGEDMIKIMSLGKIIRPISKFVLWSFINLHRVIPNYGWVLIIFSIFIKIILSPLTNRSSRSMKEMQKLQPQIAEIKEKYKDDTQRINTETMKLYKEHGVNPMGGCLPLLFQMPILFALFTIFRTTIELRHAPFIFWITDLSAPDTVYTLPFSIPLYGKHVNILPIIMVATTILQQKLSSASTNPQQKMTQYLMPIFFFFLFNQFPSGLNLYYTLFNILTVVQQKYLTPDKPAPKKKKTDYRKALRQWQFKAGKK
jgi:YidC/Oxa1 family membrane protein insertase